MGRKLGTSSCRVWKNSCRKTDSHSSVEVSLPNAGCEPIRPSSEEAMIHGVSRASPTVESLGRGTSAVAGMAAMYAVVGIDCPFMVMVSLALAYTGLPSSGAPTSLNESGGVAQLTTHCILGAINNTHVASARSQGQS